MKKKDININPLHWIVLLIIIFPLLQIITSCKPDDNPSDDNVRLIERKIYHGGLLDTRLVFEYEADKLILQKNYSYDDETETARREFVYLGDSVEVTGHMYFDGEWSLFSKIIYHFDGKKMVRTNIYTYQDSIWELQGKMEFHYSGNDLTNESWSSFDNGSWTEISRRTYEYQNGLLTRSDAYYLDSGEMQKIGREEAEYSGNKIKTVIRYFTIGDTINGSFRYDFEYDGDLLISVNYFDNDNGWIADGGKEFIYNPDGTLSVQTTTDDEGVSVEEYTYEPGRGNYEQFIHPGGGIISEENYPHPTRSVGQLEFGIWNLEPWNPGTLEQLNNETLERLPI
jgi:hypothetical protein